MIRLEFRDVTMRFADASGRASLTAIAGRELFDRRRRSCRRSSGRADAAKAHCSISAPVFMRRRPGEAFVDGERVEGPNRHVAFMLQKDLLLPWRTIARERDARRRDPGTDEERMRAGARPTCCAASISRTSPTATRINCPAACASASRSPARSRSIPRSCCSMSHFPRSMRRPASRCSTIWRRRSSARQDRAADHA